MSDGIVSLNAADFAGHTVVEITGLKLDPETIEHIALESARSGGVGLVLLSKDGEEWTPTARELRIDMPEQPVGFPSSLVGYGQRFSISRVIHRWRDLDHIDWRHSSRSKTRMALVYDRAGDATAFLAEVERIAEDEA